MARSVNKLSARTVSAISRKGHHADGGGLYLRVSDGGTKSWVFRFMRNGKARYMGLGSARDVSLSEARLGAENARRLLRQGTDPLDQRLGEKLAAKAAIAKLMTFKQCAEAFISAHEAGWKNSKHRSQWQNTLDAYAYPELGELPVGAIDTGLVLKVLEPIWQSKNETANRLRGRIETVLDWATVRGHRDGENPARWRGHLDKLLVAPSNVQAIEHHSALPYGQAGAFLADLRARDSVGSIGLQFLILTATRTGETMGARWSEFDLAKAVWTIPADRMKGRGNKRREHRVPLSKPAMDILRKVAELGTDEFVFPGQGPGPKRPLSNMAFLQVLKRMGRDDITAHGFRSTFRDWAAERTSFPNHVVEAALAHTIGDKVEAAYRRGDLFEKRRKLMDAWGEYCSKAEPADDKIIPLRMGK